MKEPSVQPLATSGQNPEVGRSPNVSDIEAGPSYSNVTHKRGGFYLSHGGSNLFYTVEGSGDPVLLVHGWSCDQSDWLFQVPFLLNHGFQVITLDQRGHGRSSDLLSTIPGSSRSLQYDPETLAEDAATLLDHLGVGGDHGKSKAAIVIGHSLGAVVASELAYRHQRMVRAIVLVDPAYYAPKSVMEPIVERLKNSSKIAPQIAADLFEQMEAPVAHRPSWMGPWRQRGTWGMPGHVVIAAFEQLTDFLGKWNTAVDYMKERKVVPRLATCADQAGADIEQNIGLGKEDRVETIASGHWHHQVDPERFNCVLEEWFKARGYLPAA